MVEIWTTNWLGLHARSGLTDACVENRLVIWHTDATDAIEGQYGDVVVDGARTYGPVLGGEIVLVVGWPRLVPTDDVPIVGFHPSPLPVGRGRAPIPHTILDGLRRSAVCLFRATNVADAGDVIERREFDVGEDWTAGDLYAEVSVQLRLATRSWAYRGLPLEGEPQDHSKATVWLKRGPADSEIPPDSSVEVAHRLVRALDGPYPPAFIRTRLGPVRLRQAGPIEPGCTARSTVELIGGRLVGPGGSFSVEIVPAA